MTKTTKDLKEKLLENLYKRIEEPDCPPAVYQAAIAFLTKFDEPEDDYFMKGDISKEWANKIPFKAPAKC